MSKKYTKPPTKKPQEKSTAGKDIKDFFIDVGESQLIASGLDFVNNKVDDLGKLAGKSKGLLETGYDAYNVLKSLNGGRAGAASVNMLGALLPGVSGKAIEEGISKIIPSELIDGTEESRYRMKAVMNGYRGSYDDLGKKFKESKTKKEKFAFGGTAMDVATPSEELAKAQRVSQQAYYGAMSDPTVAGLRGVGNMLIDTGMSMASKGMGQAGDLKGFGGFLQDNMGTINNIIGASQGFATRAAGGVVGSSRINAEGGEVIETPGGEPQELQGASHEQGGVDMQVPSGTEIYSDRLKGADGKTMADRKKTREKQIAQIEKLLQKNPKDTTLKKTLQKIKQNNDLLDKQDLSQMQFVKDLVDHTNRFAFGGIADTDEDELIPLKSKPMDVILPNTSFSITPEMDARIKNSSAPQLNTTTNTQQKGFSLDNYLGGTTLGDMIGMGANLFGANAQMKNTLANRNATPLEQNAFKNYGDQALKKIQSQYGLLDVVRDNQLQDVERNRQGTIARNNNSARGINTQRALNLATDSSMNELKANIFNQYAQQAMGITAQEAAQMAKNDQMRMQGEDKRAERELQNTDNFFNNMAKNISDKYRGIGQTGKSLNKIKEREVTQKNIEEQLELLKKGSDGELALDKIISARYGITVEELRNLKSKKSKK